ncbi:ParM/StbA family protein [Paracidovorax wautersii]|uniref:Plasmid segregation actin-type ATPase ParM n=1 Tax=Paracidovorax wautersii TaxID=1177982 RepID=A0A1I2HN60_9BURK|nr:ParM/StbA family protein [Paracidovorax wautersii]SFF31219.1 plasmid segregation actin-type ATPase ParM [Paracidovorax wautersii]
MAKEAAQARKSDDSAKQTVTFVGCDDGHDSIKIVARECEVQPDGSLKQVNAVQLTMPSKVVRGNKVLALTNENEGGGIYITDDEGDGEQAFTVTDSLSQSDVIDTRTISYPTSSVNRVLIHDALIQAGLGGKDVRIVTGLPVDNYYLRNGSERNIALIEAKKKNLLEGKIRPLNKNKSAANIVTHNVACEGIAAVFDMAINEDGSDNREFFDLLSEGPVGVIDIGGKTIDLAVAFIERGQHQIDRSRSSSIEFGMLKLMGAIGDEIAKSFDITDIPPRLMLRVLKEGRLKISGEWTEVRSEVDKAVARCMQDISGRLRAAWTKPYDLGKIIVVGGGAYTLAEPIKTGLYSQAEARSEPEYANARGMLKLAMSAYVRSAQRATSE